LSVNINFTQVKLKVNLLAISLLHSFSVAVQNGARSWCTRSGWLS